MPAHWMEHFYQLVTHSTPAERAELFRRLREAAEKRDSYPLCRLFAVGRICIDTPDWEPLNLLPPDFRRSVYLVACRIAQAEPMPSAEPANGRET
jgi:hypothetical protein